MVRVSVIIPTYNYGRFLGEAIQSVLDQTFIDFELIVVDDGSTDNTKEVVNSFKDTRIKSIHQENRGVSAAQNTGIKASGGEYIALLGSDDTWLPQNLELKVKVLDNRPELAFVCSNGYIFDDETGATLGKVWRDPNNVRKVTQRPLKEMLSGGNFIAGQSVLIRRSVFAKVGYLDESLRVGEDYDIFIRILHHFPIEIMDVPLIRLRKHAGSLTAGWDTIDLTTGLAVYDKVLHNHSLSDKELTLVRRKYARTLFRLGRYMVVMGKVATGRKRLLTSIKINSWCIRPYIYLAMSLLGDGVILTLKEWKKWSERQLSSQVVT